MKRRWYESALEWGPCLLLLACAPSQADRTTAPERASARAEPNPLGEAIPAITSSSWYEPPAPLPSTSDAELECAAPAPDSPPTLGSLMRLADCQAAAGQWQAEVLTLRACVQVDPDPESRWLIWVRLATRLEQLSHLVGAAKTWLAAVEAQPGHPAALDALRRGICLARAADLPNDLEAALDVLAAPPFDQPRPTRDELGRVCSVEVPERLPDADGSAESSTG